jgi:hypothetical protein
LDHSFEAGLERVAAQYGLRAIKYELVQKARAFGFET